MRFKLTTPQWIILGVLFTFDLIILVTLVGVYVYGTFLSDRDVVAIYTETPEKSITPVIPLISDTPSPLVPTTSISPSPTEEEDTPFFKIKTPSPTSPIDPVISPTPTGTLPPIPTIPTPDQSQIDWVEKTLVNMTPEQKIGQLMIISLNDQQKELNDCGLIWTIQPAGMFLHPDNVDDPYQVKGLIKSFQECASNGMLPLLISIDHEGEYVNRFNTVVNNFPPALGMGATGDPRLLQDVSYAAGSELAFSGINMILGPIADVLTNLDNKVVSMRTYGSEAQQVAGFVESAVRGYRTAGLIPTLKHFPGHGNVADDSHKTLPIDNTNRVGLDETHLPPFNRGIIAGAPVVMLSHVAFPNISGSNTPSSLSPEIMQLLRQDLDFNGVILTDALDMKGVPYPVPDASLRAILAGVDLLLITDPEQARAVHQRLVTALQQGELPAERVNEALRRILTLKSLNGLSTFPVAEHPEPDWQKNRDLALDAGKRSVGVLKNDQGLVPIPSGMNNVLVIAPSAPDWYYYPKLENNLRESGKEVKSIYYPSPTNGRIKDDGSFDIIIEQANQYQLLLVFTWQSHINSIIHEDPYQNQLVNNLLQTGVPMVVIAMKSPTDIMDFPNAQTYLVTYGTNEGTMEELIQVLLGKVTGHYRNPLPNLPLGD